MMFAKLVCDQMTYQHRRKDTHEGKITPSTYWTQVVVISLLLLQERHIVLLSRLKHDGGIRSAFIFYMFGASWVFVDVKCKVENITIENVVTVFRHTVQSDFLATDAEGYWGFCGSRG